MERRSLRSMEKDSGDSSRVDARNVETIFGIVEGSTIEVREGGRNDNGETFAIVRAEISYITCTRFKFVDGTSVL